MLSEQADFAEHPPTFAPELAGATSWSEEHRSLTFHLREDAVWSDGVPITAEDVRWTWQAQVSPEIAWSYADLKDAITDVEVVDPHTVRYHFREAYTYRSCSTPSKARSCRSTSGSRFRSPSGGSEPTGSATIW